MGEATASLALLGQFPHLNNSVYASFASKPNGPAQWQMFFDELYFNNGTAVSYTHLTLPTICSV
eukprot:279200-Prymnesium_polylepis.1